MKRYALLILAGIVCLGQPGLAAAVVAIYLGLSMLFSGLVDLIIYARAHGRLYGAGWLLVDGILNVLLSIFLLFHESFALLSLPLLFGMVWAKTAGTAKNDIITAIRLNRRKLINGCFMLIRCNIVFLQSHLFPAG